jgi:hypothetical protein
VGLFSLELRLLGRRFQDDLSFFLDEVEGSGGIGEIRFEGAFLQLFGLLLHLLLLVLHIPLEVVDQEDVLDRIGAVPKTVVGLLVLDEALYLLAGPFPERPCKFAGSG